MLGVFLHRLQTVGLGKSCEILRLTHNLSRFSRNPQSLPLFSMLVSDEQDCTQLSKHLNVRVCVSVKVTDKIFKNTGGSQP